MSASDVDDDSGDDDDNDAGSSPRRTKPHADESATSDCESHSDDSVLPAALSVLS